MNKNISDYESDFSLRIESLRSQLIDNIVDSKLPIEVLNLMLKDLSLDVSTRAKDYIKRSMDEYKELMKEEQDAAAAANAQPEPPTDSTMMPPPAPFMAPPPMETVENADIVDAPPTNENAETPVEDATGPDECADDQAQPRLDEHPD